MPLVPREGRGGRVQTGVPEDPMPTREQENKKLARRFHEEVWDQRNLDVIDEHIHDDFIGHDPSSPEPVRGPAGVRQNAEMLLAAFPDAEMKIERLIAEDDLLTVHRTLTGTHEGEFMGIEPTGREISVTGIAIFRIEDGKTVEEWQVVDMLGPLAQLGAVDPPGP